MSFPRYPKYKPSGVEWLGDVPEHWRTVPLKAVATHNNEVLDESTPPDAEIVYVDISGVDGVNGITNKEPMLFADAPSRARRRVRHGDVIVSTVRTYLRAIACVRDPEENLVVSTGFAVVRPREDLVSDFVGHVLSAAYFVEQVIARSTGVSYPAINASDLVAIPVLVPPKSEQTAIASFLDRETAKIDGLVGEQRRLIELLKEKRKAVISHAVTQGLNPHAPRKPSGIEWLGDVPEHWDYGPLKRFWEVVDCKHVTVPFLEEGYPVASVMEVRGFELDLSQVLRTSDEFFRLLTDGGRQPQRGDVIYCRNTANTGTSAYVGTDQPIAIGQDVVLIKSRRQNGRFLNYILHSGTMAAQLETLMVGSTFKRINVAEIRMLSVTCPPKDEQDEIVKFIDSETAKLDTLTAEAEHGIELLQERRTALISAAVTGQIDVREFATREAV
jgi:type I restriction enzyme S subunit